MKNVSKKFFKYESKSHYFCNLLKGASVNENSLKYFFREDSLRNHEYYLFLKSGVQKRYPVFVNFLTMTYDIHVLKPFEKSVTRVSPDLRAKTLLSRKYSIGCVLKEVKSGAVIDLNGFKGFIPYSLGCFSKNNRYQEFGTADVRLFFMHKVGLNVTRDKKLSFNLVLSKKQVNFLLKKMLKVYNSRLLRKGIFSFQKRNNVGIKDKKLRLILQASDSNDVFSLKTVKEILMFHGTLFK